MTRPYAFTFWQQAGETPGYIELCQRSLRRNLPPAFEHVHLDLESAKEWVPEHEHEMLWEMAVPADEGDSVSQDGRRIALFTGMLRVALIHRHGGLWVDADTLLFPQFRLLADLVAEFDLVCGEAATGNRPGNAVLGGRAGSPWFEQYWATILKRIELKRAQQDHGVKWGEFGFLMLRDLFLERGCAGAWVAPWGVLNTIDHQRSHLTFEPARTVADTLSPNALGVSIFNNAISADLRALSVETLLADDTLFAFGYRLAMGDTESPHLNIRDSAQLRALNRANLLHRHLLEDDRLRTQLRKRTEQRDNLREKLRQRGAQLDGVDEQPEQGDARARQVQKRVPESERTSARLRHIARGIKQRLPRT